MNDRQSEFLEFINHHVLTHEGSVDAWNLPFFHLSWLENFRYDSVMLFVVAVILILFGILARKQIGRIPHGFGVVAETYLVFIRDGLVYPNFGGAKVGRSFVPFFCSLFLFIVVANLCGLFPLFSTATGNVSVTAGLALIFASVSLFSIVKLGGVQGVWHAFVPSGLPVVLRPVMFFLETVSLISRTFALTIRLFANMLAGHIVVYAILSLTAMMGLVASPSILLGVVMFLFEVFVAFLQAYVFTLLAAIFMGMMVHPQH